jgi:hypothetical protein
MVSDSIIKNKSCEREPIFLLINKINIRNHEYDSGCWDLTYLTITCLSSLLNASCPIQYTFNKDIFSMVHYAFKKDVFSSHYAFKKGVLSTLYAFIKNVYIQFLSPYSISLSLSSTTQKQITSEERLLPPNRFFSSENN